MGERPTVVNVFGGTVYVAPQNVEQINIDNSTIDRIAVPPGSDEPSNHPNVEDPTEELRQTCTNVAPTGSGWVKLSEKIYMCNNEPIKENTPVYKGKQAFANEWRDVAIKLIPYTEKNFNEVKLHLKLEEHPNIIRMFEGGKLGEIVPQIYIVMELCPQTLRDFIDENRGRPFDFEQRFSYAKQIIAGVAFIHKKNILHRDIKLENILISPSKDYIRVADFGLSKQLPDGHSGAKLSFQGAGSDGYRAPEMLAKNPEASFRSDSFSLGIVLAMLFSDGHHPYGPDPQYWRTHIIDNKPFDLSAIEGIDFDEVYVSKIYQLLTLISQTLSHNRFNRPTPQEMLQNPFFAEPVDANNPNMAAIEKRIKFLTEKLTKPLQDIGYEKSARMLESLRKLRKTDDLKILLQIAECHLHLMSDEKDLCIANVATFITNSRMRSAWDVLEEAKIKYSDGHPVQAMILYKITHDLHKYNRADLNSPPSAELNWIRYRIYDIFYALKPLTKCGERSRDIAIKYGITYMENMLQEIREVPDVSIEARAEWELACLIDIVVISAQFREYQKGIELGERGSTIMKQQLGETLSNHKQYGRLLHHLGDAYHDSDDHQNAKNCYVTAIEVKTKALDYVNEDERRDDIKKTKLKLTRDNQTG